MSAARELVAPEPVGRTAVAPLAKMAAFSDSVGRHHRAFYKDYDVFREHVAQAVGDISSITITGKLILGAVFCRPNMQPVPNSDKVIYLPVKEIKEDWYQHKTILILKVGPGAFQGSDGDGPNHVGSYYDEMFGLVDKNGEIIPGSGKPRRYGVGDFLFANPNSGIQLSFSGLGASRPQGVDHRGAPMDLFEWDGWPCRVMTDDNILGRLEMPHSIV